ncbi:MAG TPA: hypothetical protein VGQ36_09375 [Thermoanaerobaculia bacterium]|jgi:hypothetical protein|nr:hypothetical protein [Thermoanaerobaculia bacterium]
MSVLRLTFSYQGQAIELVSTQAVDMKIPPADSLAWDEKSSGFWVVLRDGGGQPLYRRVTNNPIQTSVEVPSDDPQRPLERHEVASPEGVFVLLVPDLPQARTVALFSSPGTQELSAAAAREIASFDLKRRRS